LLLAVTVEPERRNYPEISFGVFDAAERQARRRALEATWRKREKSHDVAAFDLAAISEGEERTKLVTTKCAQLRRRIAGDGDR
jgi:hypothetical protein